MTSTSVNLPGDLLVELDRLARERGVSRNRLILEACRRTIEKREEWPSGFFDQGRLTAEDLADLRDASNELLEIVQAARSNRVEPAPL